MERKVKYKPEFKLKCVNAVLLKGQSLKSVALEHGFSESNLRLWILFYKMYGRSGLKPRLPRTYSPNFKFHVLETIKKESLSLRAACVRFDITSESVIIHWRRSYEQDGVSGLINRKVGRPKQMIIKRKPRKSTKPLSREEDLLQEIERLKAENALLKKLQALTQTKKKQKP